MIVISDACTINIINDASRIIIDDSRVMLQTVVSHTDKSRGIIYNRNMFIVQPTGVLFKITRFLCNLRMESVTGKPFQSNVINTLACWPHSLVTDVIGDLLLSI